MSCLTWDTGGGKNCTCSGEDPLPGWRMGNPPVLATWLKDSSPLHGTETLPGGDPGSLPHRMIPRPPTDTGLLERLHQTLERHSAQGSGEPWERAPGSHLSTQPLASNVRVGGGSRGEQPHAPAFFLLFFLWLNEHTIFSCFKNCNLDSLEIRGKHTDASKNTLIFSSG